MREPNDTAIALLLDHHKAGFDDVLGTVPLPPGPRPIPLEVLRTIRAKYWEFLNVAMKPPIEGCSIISQPDPQVTTNLQGVTTATASATVSRDFTALEKALDPQNWDALDVPNGRQCTPFFVMAHACERDGTPVACAPIPGTPWDGYLYEKFYGNFNLLGQSYFQAVLDIDPTTGAADYGFTYKLLHPESGEVWVWVWSALDWKFVWEKWTGSIDQNQGYLRAKQSAGAIQLEGNKTLHFIDWHDPHGGNKDAEVNALAAITLQAISGTFAEAACCTPPEPEPCAAGEEGQ